MTDFLRWLREENLGILDARVTPTKLVEMINLIDDGTISGKIGKSVLRTMMKTGKTAREIVEEEGLLRIASTEEIVKLAEKVIRENPQAVQDAFKDEKAVHFLIGQLMKLTRGKADPALANGIMREKLTGLRQQHTST